MDTVSTKGEQFNRIGGFLWFIAIGVVLNVVIALFIATKSADVGVPSLAMALFLAWSFWSRKKIFPYAYVVVQVVSIFLYASLVGGEQIGRDLAMPIVLAIYLFVGNRPRRTFTQPLLNK